MLASSGARPTMHRVKDRWTELFILSLSLCCSMGQVTIGFLSVSTLAINEGGMRTTSVCRVPSFPASNDISFSLSASPFTSELTLPTNPVIPQGRSCEAVTITSMDNNVRQDTRTFQISLSSSTADVDQNQSQFLINILDNDSNPGGTVPMCPTPTAINSSPDSCSSYSSGSMCTYRCNNGFVKLSGDDSRTCSSNTFRWSGNPLFCIPIIIQFQSVSSATFTEGGGVTRSVCLVSSALTSNDISFSLSASPFASELTLPTNLFIAEGSSCIRVTITSTATNGRQDTRTFQISLSSSTVDVDQNQGQFLINVQDNGFTSGDTVSMCPTPTVINSSPVSCNSFTSGSMCTYRCNNGFVSLSGDDSRTCSRFTFRWSGNPLFCIPSINGCTSNPCMSGGSCIDHFHGYSCLCAAGYTGINCEEDCTVLQTTFCMNPGVSCNCTDESCDPDTGLCSSSCTIVNTCPANIESVSLSQVNPSSSVNINCTLRGSTAILQRLQLRLSSKSNTLDENGITRLTISTGDKVVSTFRVENVTREKTLFCVLLQQNYLIGGVSVINFVHELPVLNAAPISEDVSNTSITISWRAWDPTMDDGDPPIVAYIPYYRMDVVWISGPRILTNETYQFTIDNLPVDTLYEFSVAAVREGENGEGRRSPVASLKTYCNVPDVAVSVNVQVTSSNKVNVSWQIPIGEEVMCSTGVTGYKVYYRIEGSIDDTSELAGTVEDADTRWFIVDDGLLEPGTAYIFFVTVITDQESGFRKSGAIQAPAAGTSALVYLISLIIISVILIGIIVVFIKIRYRGKSSSKDKKTVKVDDDDGVDTDYVNTAIADDPEDYIPLEEQSRTVSSSKYEDLNLKPQGGESMTTQYEVTIVPQPQKPEATPRYQTRNVKGVNSGAYEDVGVSSENRQLPDVPQSHPSDNEDEEHGYVVPDRLEEYTGVYINIKNNRKLVQPGPIKVAEFHMFMSRNKEDVVNDIVQQFMALPSGPQYPWSDALKFQNKPRNFFKTILAYDHSRVKLDTYGSDARSDYINASYIKNQQGKTPFIAAQGPQEGTVDDFWKMVWQENVEIIVMVTDNIEKNKLLCCTYWPEKVRTSEVFGDISVLLMESTSYTTHTIRKLNLLKGNQKAEVHTVTQVHVHSWQYGSVPKETASVISIIKKVKSLQTDGSSSPLLVHCSNGVGATGTFIAVYVLMDTIKKNKDVNIFDFVKRMREDRVDMVQTRIQYLFIFECLLAVLQSTDSQISCDQLKKLGHAAIKLKSKKEYKVLQESAIEKQHSEDYIGNSPENQHKNRFQNLIPVDEFRPVLKSEGNTFGSNSFINAIHLTDFEGREFIMTQSPLSSTVEDFWRLVYDYECTTIVMLNTVDGSDETVIQYWPGGAHGSAQYGLMKVVCTSTSNKESCIQSQFQVAHKKVAEKSVSVDHFAFCGWSGNQPDVSRLRQFIRITGNKSTGPVLVHCINGVGLSSVYVIAKTESERLEQEGSVDVCQCLTKLRKICPHAIQTQEEYTLCYQLLKDHVDNPEEYAVVY